MHFLLKDLCAVKIDNDYHRKNMENAGICRNNCLGNLCQKVVGRVEDRHERICRWSRVFCVMMEVHGQSEVLISAWHFCTWMTRSSVEHLGRDVPVGLLYCPNQVYTQLQNIKFLAFSPPPPAGWMWQRAVLPGRILNEDLLQAYTFQLPDPGEKHHQAYVLVQLAGPPRQHRAR